MLYRAVFIGMLFGWVGGVYAQTNPQPAPDRYITATVDNPTPYVGEQVVYSFNIFTGINLTNYPNYERPDFEGFWRVSELTPSSTVSGQYTVTTVSTVLFAQRTGELVIPAGRLTFSNNSVIEPEQTLVSNSVTVNPRPLPDGAPAGFDGAVGSPFFLEAFFTRSTVAAGDPVTFNVAVEGVGNIELLNAPLIEFPSGWQLYPQPPVMRISTESAVVSGRKVFSWLIIPTDEGGYQIPPVRFHYFDPRNAVYQSLVTEPLNLDVLPGGGDIVVAPIVGLSLAQPDALQLKALTSQSRGFRFNIQWWLWLAPPLIPLGAVAWQWSREQRGRLIRRQQAQQALRHARASLATVTRAHDDEDAYRQYIGAVWGYFVEKWGKPTGGLSPVEVQAELVQRKIDPELVTRLFRCVQLAEERRYAPGDAGSMRALLKQTLNVLIALDQALEQPR